MQSGLKFIVEKENFDYVIPMDGDGEDRPEELNLLFNKTKEHPDKVITAERIKRSGRILIQTLLSNSQIFNLYIYRTLN